MTIQRIGMDVPVLFQGMLLGFSIAAPVGPIGVLCIRRTLADGRLTGLVSGLGAATADGFYGMVAAFGITFISNVMVSQQIWLRVFGGAFLVYLGIRTFLARPTEGALASQGNGLAGAYLSTLLLTLTNPLTIISFAAILAGFGVGAGGYYLSAVVFVLGVFCGSALWWFILSGGISFFRERFSLNAMHWVNRISGGLITAFGVLALFSLGV